ncbi:MAG: alginate export family protein, partial [Phycisphaerales bacterium]
MINTTWAGVCLACLCFLGAPDELPAQSDTGSATEQEKEAQLEEQAPATPEKPLPGPKYLNLRWDEDFCYLDGQPDSYQGDFFDPVKNIRLDDDWRLSVGGEFRYRLEAETNKTFGVTEPAQDTFHVFRYMLHADLKYRKLFRAFAQGIAAFDEERDLAPRGIDENRWDLHQLFFDLRVLGEDLPLTLRVGRQELQYGNQRYVSPLDWAAVRRRFDGVKLFAKGKRLDADLW